MEDVPGLNEETFLTPATHQKNEVAKTEEVEGTRGKAKELYTLVELNIQLPKSRSMAMNGPVFHKA